MVNLDEIRDRCEQIYNDAEKLLIEVGYRSYGQICIVKPDNTDESRTLYHILEEYMKALDTASICMDQVCAEEVEEGIINKKEDGTYFFNGNELEAGDVVQVYDEESRFWKVYMLDDYFDEKNRRLVLKRAPDIELDGLKIRHAKTGWS